MFNKKASIRSILLNCIKLIDEMLRDLPKECKIVLLVTLIVIEVHNFIIDTFEKYGIF